MKNLFLLAIAGLAFTTACKKDDTTTPAALQVTGPLNAASSVQAKGDPAVVSNGTGSMTGTFDPTSKVLNYSLAFSGLTGPATAAHLHFGDSKHRNPVPTVPFTNVAATSGTIAGTVTLTQQQADSLTMGHLYANIHTGNYPNGEVRANLTAK